MTRLPTAALKQQYSPLSIYLRFNGLIFDNTGDLVMPNQSKHASINIGLIQAREALMTQFRPILNQANITDQQWRIIRLLAENGTLDFQDLANQACILRPSLTGILTRLSCLFSLIFLFNNISHKYYMLKLL